MAEEVITARCTAHAFNSRLAIQYFPGLDYQLDLANKEHRKLLWLKTPRGKWIFQFDRANSSNTLIRIWFCKVCGEPFDKFTGLGNHVKTQKHDKVTVIVKQTKQEDIDEEEERAVAEQLALEANDGNEQNTMLKDAILAQQADIGKLYK